MNQQPISIPMNHNGGHKLPSKKKPGSLTFTSIGLLFALTLLIVAVIAYLIFGTKAPKLFDKNKMQAVFLTGGQVYFGNMSQVNSDYIKMSNIYYLKVDQQIQPQNSQSSSGQNLSLAKLGCELHGPEDSMIINRSQVLFWEDLKNKGDDQDGQVITAVKAFVKDNPNGKKCTYSNAGSSSSTPASTTTPTTTPNKQ